MVELLVFVAATTKRPPQQWQNLPRWTSRAPNAHLGASLPYQPHPWWYTRSSLPKQKSCQAPFKHSKKQGWRYFFMASLIKWEQAAYSLVKNKVLSDWFILKNRPLMHLFVHLMSKWFGKKVDKITRLKLTQHGSHHKRKLIFQPSVFRCELLVSERVFRIYINGNFISKKSLEFHQASSNIIGRCLIKQNHHHPRENTSKTGLGPWGSKTLNLSSDKAQKIWSF